MNRRDASQRLARLIAALFLLLACALLGAAIGLMSVRLFLPEPTMGWDGIADALGGMMVGGGLGLLTGAYLAGGLSVRARWWSAAVATLLAAN
jgi:hypothetical protein